MQVAPTQGATTRRISFEGEMKEEKQAEKDDNTLFTIGMGRMLAIVEMEIMGY